MRISRCFLGKAGSAVARAPRAPLPTSGNTFDAMLPSTSNPRKAWHGQDKDKFFHDKFAHVHAKQLQKRKLENAGKSLSKKPPAASKNTSAKQPRPDFASKLQETMAKDARLEHVYGTSVVKAVLNTRNVLKVWTGYSLSEVDPLIMEKCNEAGIPLVLDTPMQHLNILSDGGVHNKYVARVHKRELPQVTAIAADNGCVWLGDRELKTRLSCPVALYIDQVTDTHNMGALLRSACWFGVDFVAFSSRNSAPVNAAVLKGSAGAAEFVNIAEAPQPLRLFENLKDQGWTIASTLPDEHNSSGTGLTPVSLEVLRNLDKPLLLVVGSEGEGVRKSLVQRSTHSITLKGYAPPSAVESLNVSVACAVILSSIVR